ncbi:unnamed protein product, partial [Iphiclides podalirius]
MPLEWRIYEGNDLQFDKHSYLVKLEFQRTETLTVTMCSGSIISSSWIISSAHCFHGSVRTVLVSYGTKRGLRRIARVHKRDTWLHPSFTPKGDAVLNRERDIALLRLRPAIASDANIKPLKLAAIYPRAGEPATIAGYGRTEVYSTPPKQGAVVITQCPFPKGTAICTEGAVRTAPGDSGGPLIYDDSLVGLTSAGCTDVQTNRMCLTVYTSIAANINWIRQVTKIPVTIIISA